MSYVFTRMWNLRNLTEDHGGEEGENIVSNREEANHKRLLNRENKLRVDGRRGEGQMGEGHWRGRLLGRAPSIVCKQ